MSRSSRCSSRPGNCWARRDAMDALAAAYKPGRTFGEAFGEFYRKAFAAQGLLVLDAAGSEVHRLGAPVLQAAIERADELHAALLERNKALEAAGYHAQVTVAPQSSLLFLIDERNGARMALKRTAPSAAEPGGSWQAGREKVYDGRPGGHSGLPSRNAFRPAALLRPVFQDFLLATSLIVGGPAEIAYFAQSAVLFERILGRTTAAEPRLSATLIEPAIGGTPPPARIGTGAGFQGVSGTRWRNCWRRGQCRWKASEIVCCRNDAGRRTQPADRVDEGHGCRPGAFGRHSFRQDALPDESSAAAGGELRVAA